MARVYIKYLDNQQMHGAKRCDIVEILPVGADPGNKTLDTFLPIDIDLTIPCGAAFTPPYQCKNCPDNHPDTCDVRKYKVAEWSAGTVEDPPKIVKKRMYYVDIDTVLSQAILAIMTKANKNAAEKTAVLQLAANNPKTKSVITKKA